MTCVFEVGFQPNKCINVDIIFLVVARRTAKGISRDPRVIC